MWRKYLHLSASCLSYSIIRLPAPHTNDSSVYPTDPCPFHPYSMPTPQQPSACSHCIATKATLLVPVDAIFDAELCRWNLSDCACTLDRDRALLRHICKRRRSKSPCTCLAFASGPKEETKYHEKCRLWPQAASICPQWNPAVGSQANS